MRTIAMMILGALAIMLSGGCGTGDQLAGDPLKYPYNAPPEKAAKIIKNYRLLKEGMAQELVLQMMGTPDEKNNIYNDADHFESRTADGEVWVYLVQRLKPYGSSYDRKEKSVRLEFGLDKTLRRIEPMNMRGTDLPRDRQSRTGIPGAAY